MNQSSSENKPKIFVAGSSWARGEWSGPRVAHRGLMQYFEDAGYCVIDCTQARSWHSRVAELLDEQLIKHYHPGDIVFWVQADPLLDIIMPELATMQVKRSLDVTNLSNFTETVQQYNGIANLIAYQQDQIYQQLDSIAKHHNVTVDCIGGTYNLNNPLLTRYSNLKSTVVSWIDLLIGHLREYPGIGESGVGVTYTWTIDYINFENYSKELEQKVRNEFYEISRYAHMLQELIFHPDGLHPNREGHKILFKHLQEKLKL